MGLFDRQFKTVPSFGSRSEAFDYLLASLVADGVPIEEAANRANTFAEVVARNKKLPNVPERPKTAIEQGITVIQQVASVKREYPDVWDLVTGALGGLIGGFAGANIAGENEEKRDEIDFENLK
ncbi:MAG: hypothetical protein II236_00270 [Alistipes sp.]|nr:hypothetical protein [Alistipes sp.]